MPYGDALFQRLRLAKRSDLVALLADLKCDAVKFRDATDEDLINAISVELRSAAGNSLVNVMRDPHEFSYKQILIDVADKLATGPFGWTTFKLSGPETEAQIEDYIHDRYRSLIEQRLSSMSDVDKVKLQQDMEAELRGRGLPDSVVRASVSAVATGALTGVVAAPLVATTVYASLWTSIFGLSAGQLALGGLMAGGPAGLLVAGGLLLSGTSYSKTIPAVIRLILIRQSSEAEAKLATDK